MTTTTAPHRLLLAIVALSAPPGYSPWAVQDSGCRTPGGGVGDCINIHDCQKLTEFLIAAPKPLTQDVRDLLLEYRCGFSGKTVWVCCPRESVIPGGAGGTTAKPVVTVVPPPTTNGPVSRGTLADLSKHRNYGLLDQSCGSVPDDEDRIINGELAAILEFPWMALISYRSGNSLGFKCGGTLISNRYVLTAAHCITQLGSRTLAGVRLGEYDVSKVEDCSFVNEDTRYCAPAVQDMSIEEVVPHPLYNRTSLSHDIGIIRLAREANITVESVRPVCLPVAPSSTKVKLKKAIVTGWGQTENSTTSNILLKVTVPIVDQPTCQNRYMAQTNLKIDPAFQICAGGSKAGDSCKGDSGGPIQFIAPINNNIRFVQYGIVSYGPTPCTLNNIPGVYTNVTSYVEWILDNMKP